MDYALQENSIDILIPWTKIQQDKQNWWKVSDLNENPSVYKCSQQKLYSVRKTIFLNMRIIYRIYTH